MKSDATEALVPTSNTATCPYCGKPTTVSVGSFLAARVGSCAHYDYAEKWQGQIFVHFKEKA